MPTPRIHDALVKTPVALDLPTARQAAVAMLIDRDEQVLFVERAHRAGDPWSGQIAFPGGHLEGEESWTRAAIRETHEEIGLAVTPDRRIGALDDLQTPAMLPSRVVRPLVFAVDRFGPLTLEPGEVADVLIVPLETLLAGEGRGRFELAFDGRNVTLPCVDLDGRRLWGMTLRVVDDLLHRLDGRGRGLARSPARP